MDFRLGFGWVDPDGGWFWGRGWLDIDEAVWIGVEGDLEGAKTLGVDFVDASVVDLVWGHQADSKVVVFAVVPIEEAAAEGLGVLDGAESVGELGLVFTGFEEAFREGIVVGGVGPAVGFGDAEIGEEEGGGLGFHGGPSVGVEGELAGRDGVLFDGVVEQRLEQGDAFGVGDPEGDDPSTEDVDDHVEIKIGPLGWPHQLGDVPRPDLVRGFGEVRVLCK